MDRCRARKLGQVSLWLAVFLAGSGVAKAQLLVNKYFDADSSQLAEQLTLRDSVSGVLEGPYLKYYPNGNLEQKGQFEDNLLAGLWEYYFQSGQLKTTGYYQAGQPAGTWTYYYENGQVSKKGDQQGQQQQGYWQFFYESGQRKALGHYQADSLVGLWNFFYEDGQLRLQVRYTDSLGLAKEFYTDGSLSASGAMSQLQKVGPWTYYHPSGAVQGRGSYEQGLRSGAWEFFHSNEQLASAGDYDQGKKHGPWVYYHPNGQLKAKGEQRNGQRDGYWKVYRPSGKLALEGDYGGLAEEGVREYYPDGTLSAEGFMKDGQKHGPWKYYYPDGALEGEADYDQGNGMYSGYYRDGSLKMKGEIRNGQKVGEWELYDGQGNVVGHYKTYYEEQVPMFRTERDSLVLPNPRAAGLTPEYQYRGGRSKYFTPRVNEFRGFIVGLNPAALLVGELPFSVEYYVQERLGFELQVHAIRQPFFTDHATQGMGDFFREGFSVAYRSKFYEPSGPYGMLYWSPEVRFTSLQHGAYLAPNGLQRQRYGAHEERYEVGFTVGDRLMRQPHKGGFTLDVYLGVGVGYRNYRTDYAPDATVDATFDSNVEQRGLTVPLRGGFFLGYAF